MKQINILKKAAGAISILLLLLSLAACGNMLEERKENTVVEPVENAGAGILVRGEIKVQGAVPSRAATSCFDGAFSWKIFAQNQDLIDSVGEPDADLTNIFAESFTTTNEFTLTLPIAGNWSISASGYAGTYTKETLPSSSEVFSGSDTYTITKEGSNRAIIIHPVVWGDSLFPAQGANPLKGSINLPITSNAENVYQVSAKLVKKVTRTVAGTGTDAETEEDVVEIPPKTFTAGSSSLTASDVPAGFYTAKINFEDSIGNILYSCHEGISVYPGLTTDTWYGTAPYLHNGAFTLTSSLVEKYGAELVPSTNYVLYNYNSGTYQYYLKDSASEAVSGTADVSVSSSSFCFDADGTLYSLTENSNGDIVKTSNNKTFTLSESSLTGVLVDLKTNVFYTYKGFQETLTITKYPNLISEEDINTHEANNSVYVSGTGVYYNNAKLAIYNSVVYILSKTEYGSGPYVFGWYNLTNGTHGSLGLMSNSAVATLLEKGTVSDMIYQNGSIYMLLDGTKNDFWDEFKYSSRGAVLCYNCQTEEVTVCGWIDDATDISGKVFYAINGADNKAFLKQNASFIEDGDEKAAYIANRANWITIDDTIPSGSGVYPSLYFPSEAQENSAFYGPKKFIAIKPKKLVIADEGCFFYTDSNDAFCFKNVNRVVTVDLESFAISSVDDVSVTFGEEKASDMVSSGYTSVDNLNLSNCIYSTSGSEYNSSSMESVKLSIPLGE